MHQTTVRFGPDLWEAVEAECTRLGVSAAQYVRESALARLAYAAGRRHEEDYEYALVAAGVSSVEQEERAGGLERARAQVIATAEAASENVSDATAVGAQSELVRMRARAIREKSRQLREQRRGRR
jgi:hypothetical protein